MISCFFDAHRVAKWKDTILGTPELVSNYMCLSPDAHHYYDNAFFAFKPLQPSSDRKTLQLQFFWLPKRDFSMTQDLLEVPSLPSNLNHREYNAGLYNFETEEVVRSGDIITLTTHDPEHFPLPDFELLWLKWMLHRIVALRGASGIYPKDDFNSDDGGIAVRAWLRDVQQEGDDLEEEKYARGLRPSMEAHGGIEVNG
jgi:hypothetical protein